MPKTITLPNNWIPMKHQMPVWTKMQEGIKRAALCWHRRAGKDSFAINFLATKAMQTPGVYWHMLPTATQARKVIWNGIDRHGRKVLDQAIPPEIRVKKRDDEMYVELINGSIIQLVGSDNFDSLVGANPVGVVFSEYAIANPLAWAYIRPMLAENGGWAIFISTPRGHNHFHRLWHAGERNPDRWYVEMRDISQTWRDDGTPIITEEVLQDERDEGMDESLLQQEYFVSWEGGLQGAFFTEEINNIRNKQMLQIPIDTTKFAMTAWDIGLKDKTAIGIFMAHPVTGYPVLMDAYEDRNKGLPFYIKHVHKWREEYNFHYHFGPHDLKKREYTNNTQIVDTAQDLGINFEVLPKGDLASGIDNLRAFLRVLHVNENPRTLHVLDMLSSYRREYDEKQQIFKDNPVHDFASDSTDMMRYAAQAWYPDLLNTDTSRAAPIQAKRAIGR
jgi:phage terminase large subunit